MIAARLMHNRRQFEIDYGGRRMTIAVKGLTVEPGGDVVFEVYCHETAAYELVRNSLIRSCLHLKTGRAIRDLGRRYTVNRLRY